jgi:hypothetical protein
MAIRSISQAQFTWVLLGPDGLPIQGLNPNIAVSSPATAGQGEIEIASTQTSQLAPGRYADSLRVTIADQVSTTWVGYFLIDANPFFAP